MLLVDMLKERINSLPTESFKTFWAAIEETDAALLKAGPLGALVLEYLRIRHESAMAQAGAVLCARVAALEEDLQINAVNVAEFNRLKAAYEDTYRKLVRAKTRAKAAKKTK